MVKCFMVEGGGVSMRLGSFIALCLNRNLSVLLTFPYLTHIFFFPSPRHSKPLGKVRVRGASELFLFGFMFMIN